MSARFVLCGTGYYDQKHPLAADIPGLDKFKGEIIHPQFWPEDYDYTDKNVVIVGSGATAVSILPSMTEKAKHVTQLQRSPGYFLSLPTVGAPLDNFVRRWMPTSWAHAFIRLKFMVGGFMFIRFCRMFPDKAKAILKSATEKQLPKDVPYDPHFTPKYLPWQQRMCIVPGKLPPSIISPPPILTIPRRRLLRSPPKRQSLRSNRHHHLRHTHRHPALIRPTPGRRRHRHRHRPPPPNPRRHPRHNRQRPLPPQRPLRLAIRYARRRTQPHFCLWLRHRFLDAWRG